jgi:hypothetical protein
MLLLLDVGTPQNFDIPTTAESPQLLFEGMQSRQSST